MNKEFSLIETSYRAFYGKLFSALINQFGINNVTEIEDAIQNSFLKLLKNWNFNPPQNKENWLFIVSKNDVINQLKKKHKNHSFYLDNEHNLEDTKDLRLDTILFIASSKKNSAQTKIIFVLKNIFGLHIKEIEESTLLKKDAIYKSIKRANKSLKVEYENTEINDVLKQISSNEISIVEEILYAVFNIGFDSFNEKNTSIINDNLCLEALALAKLLHKEKQQHSTSNLLALFCFHISRIPAKVYNGKIISFFKQKRELWNTELINLGLFYLKKTEHLDKFYIESLIVNKYMSTSNYSIDFWKDISNLYEVLIKISNSPIIKLNYCYALHNAQQVNRAFKILEDIESQLPKKHVYYSLIKANLIQDKDSIKSKKMIDSVINNINQTIRKDFLLENGFINY